MLWLYHTIIKKHGHKNGAKKRSGHTLLCNKVEELYNAML